MKSSSLRRSLLPGLIVLLFTLATQWAVSADNKNPNKFNRLMIPMSERNPPPAEDGIHDPENFGTGLLQAPRESFRSLPRAPSGNNVNWMKALENGDINPRYDRDDAISYARLKGRCPMWCTRTNSTPNGWIVPIATRPFLFHKKGPIKSAWLKYCWGRPAASAMAKWPSRFPNAGAATRSPRREPRK